MQFRVLMPIKIKRPYQQKEDETRPKKKRVLKRNELREEQESCRKGKLKKKPQKRRRKNRQQGSCSKVEPIVPVSRQKQFQYEEPFKQTLKMNLLSR